MISAQDILTKNPPSVKPDYLVTKARSIVRKEGKRALPVVEGGKLVGIVTRGDILRVTSSKTNLTIAGVMKRNVEVLAPEEELFSIAKRMTKVGVRQMPVIENGALIGMVSATDVLRKLVEHDYNPVKKQVADIMIRDIVYCTPEEELSVVWSKMLSSGFSGFPVLKKKKVIGFVSRRDIIKRGYARLSMESGKSRASIVSSVMSPTITTITEDMSTKDVAKTMVERGIIRVPVVNDKNELRGIVDMVDILRAYAG